MYLESIESLASLRFHQWYGHHQMAGRWLVRCLILDYGEVSTCQSWRACHQQLPEARAQVPEETTLSTHCQWHALGKEALVDQRHSFQSLFGSFYLWTDQRLYDSPAAKVSSLLSLIGSWNPTELSTSVNLIKSSIAFYQCLLHRANRLPYQAWQERRKTNSIIHLHWHRNWTG